MNTGAQSLTRVFLLAAAVVAVITVACLPGWAQCTTPCTDVYQDTYFLNANSGVDQQIEIINPGLQGGPKLRSTQGYLCADIYVFDYRQEMLECCHCPISPNGLLVLSLKNNLLNKPLTGPPGPNNGVVKIVSDAFSNCSEFGPVPTPDLNAWATHLHGAGQGVLIPSEAPFTSTPLSASELSTLGLSCLFVQQLGSGAGICTCGTGG
ncbi:MAG TPA: hypothetical protein VK473_11715 [Terriglobales bacterium]|nr:hypothetical protein [Terriglobales bacterium]